MDSWYIVVPGTSEPLGGRRFWTRHRSEGRVNRKCVVSYPLRSWFWSLFSESR